MDGDAVVARRDGKMTAWYVLKAASS
jgi:hypothetical protein